MWTATGSPAFVTGTRPGGARGQLVDLELRHRQRARCEDRIRTGKDTGLRNLPLHGFASNQVWCELIALAMELTAWAQMLALDDHPARCWEPKRLRLRVFSAPRAPGQRRPTATPALRNTLAMGGSDRLRDHPPADAARALTAIQPPRPPRKDTHPGPWNPAHPTRQPGPTADPSLKNDGRLSRYATQPTSRKIQARERGINGRSPVNQWRR